MNAEIKEKLIQYSKKIKIDKIGFTTAESFENLRQILQNHRRLGYESGFEEKDIEKRVDPKLTLENAKSIIAIAIAYPSKMIKPPKSESGSYRGFISRSAWGIDYHSILMERLNQLGLYLKKIVPEAQYIAMADTGTLSDHAVAERAGIGWIGKNSLLITPEYGSYVYLGELVTNIEFPIDQLIEDKCGDCTKCLEICPTKAIVNPGQVNAKLCLSYVTQRKDMLEEYYMEKLGNRLYGCDSCQTVCPYNRGIYFDHQQETLPDHELAKPLLKPLLSILNKDFQTTWGNTAAAWRGKKPIQRNAIISLAHFKDKSSLPELQQILTDDERPMIRQTAAWAVGKIGGTQAGEILEVAKISEKDQSVLEEIERIIKKLK